ncbi:hypothetical protein AB0P21_01160 [Kribbella sp. NPDC056861]|uniref:hypothetical protein n=1 Tax=Kribbella sp. NPDC056861 TaxID=3154857 RepID=UPI00341BC367
MRIQRYFVPFVVVVVMLAVAGIFHQGGRSPDTPTAAPAGFVYRQGSQLMLNGQQYKFAGLNASSWFGCWTGEKEATTDADLDRYFRELNPRSMTRVWHYPGRQDLGLMRRIEAAAARYGQFLMVTLTDGNDGGSQCGGLPLNYADPAPLIAHARAVVAPFATSAAIAVWEVCNGCSVEPGLTKSWYRAVTDEIKRLSPNTLVALGASCHRGQALFEDCLSTNDLPGNDLIGFQEFDDDGGDASHWADETAQLADDLEKPAYISATGVANNGGDCGSYACNVTQMIEEFDSYLADTEFAGVLWWGFKWTRDDLVTVTLGNPYWPAMSAYRHPYNGGGLSPPTSTNLLSQKKPVTASTVYPGFAAANAVDGNSSTR